MTLAELLEAGRELPPEQRVVLANELLASVDAEADDGEEPFDTEVREAWMEEIARRVDELMSGRVQTVPFSEVDARMSAKIEAARG